MPFVTAGYPSLAISEELVLALVRGGADLIEIGVPFSDPLADGATVQRANQAALANGVRLADCLPLVRRLRAERGVEVPLLLMSYYNPILQYGPERFAADAAAAGVDGFIVTDLPTEESDELLAACRAHGRDLIFLLAPTSTDARIAEVAERASGFVYCVSLTGVTGARDTLPDLAGYLARVRARTDLPLAIGFGVSTAEHVRQVGAVADGAVVASALINHLDRLPLADQPAAAETFVRNLRGGAGDGGRAPRCGRLLGAASMNTPQPPTPDPHPTLVCRGVRGATTTETNTAEDILEATTDLLRVLIRLNDVRPEDVASAFFTTTADLTAAFPAVAARNLGWTEVPLLCAHEMAVPGALGLVVRVLLHLNTTRTAAEIRHVYLTGARALRPEWGIPDDELATLLGRPTALATGGPG